MINANSDIFRLSLELRFSLPLYKFVSTPAWREIVKAEDYFFGSVVRVHHSDEVRSTTSFEKSHLNAEKITLHREHIL